MSTITQWLGSGADVEARRRMLLGLGSFLLPLLVWSLVSYVPFIWHPKIYVANPGGVDFFQVGMLVNKSMFREEVADMQKAHPPLP